MRTLIALAIAVVIVAIGFGVWTVFIPRSIDDRTASATLSPYEMHLNYKSMKEMPVREVKDPF
jgi:hypothetical protein